MDQFFIKEFLFQDYENAKFTLNLIENKFESQNF